MFANPQAVERARKVLAELDKQIMIKTAAAKHKGIVYSVARPGRHDAVLAKVYAELNLSGGFCCDEQGFITNNGRFVSRLEAAKIALESGQIKYLKWPPNLYSEDLW